MRFIILETIRWVVCGLVIVPYILCYYGIKAINKILESIGMGNVYKVEKEEASDV